MGHYRGEMELRDYLLVDEEDANESDWETAQSRKNIAEEDL